MMPRSIFLRSLPGLLAIVAAPLAGQSKTYQNPVLDEDFPDPAPLQVGSVQYAYATGTDPRGGATPYIRMSRSADMVHWSPSVTVLAPPPWAVGSAWAPHVIRDPNAADRYVMFFSAKADPGLANVPDDADKCLGVAVARLPTGPFLPQPDPLRCGPRFENIDPMAFQARGSSRYVLYWGSARLPIKSQPLAADLLGFEPGSRAVDVIAPVPGDPYASLIEGSWVLDHGAYRYIFLSGSDCCSGPDRYAVTVARRKLTGEGGWERFKGSKNGAILRRNAAWSAPGHNGVFVDGAGDAWLIYHARRPGQKRTRVMLIDRIVWQDGWPRIVGDGPSSSPIKAPAPLAAGDNATIGAGASSRTDNTGENE